MTLENTLEDWLKTPPIQTFKRGGDSFPFYSKYETFKHYLDNDLHKLITKQAIYEEFRAGKDLNKIIYLNDHGPDHIKTVIERASNLVNNGTQLELNPREVYFLLNAIQVHDIGNFYGRYGHESKILKAVNEGLKPILFDATEVMYIANIAMVHGGTITNSNGALNKNTFKTIKPEITSDGYPIRQQLLAAILRFSDELADDKHRADIKALNERRLPKGSEIFHAYAACLDSVLINHVSHQIELHFKIPKKYLLCTFGKIQKDNTIKEQYLIDEIFERSIKMYTERIYCAKFWNKFIDIDKIWAQIEFYEDAKDNDNFDELFVHNDITYTLNDNQYPETPTDIHELCPDLNYGQGLNINGENLLNKINK